MVASKVEVVESRLSLAKARYTREALAKVKDVQEKIILKFNIIY